MNSQVPISLDHLVYYAADLDDGLAALEAKLGTAPAKGGSHPGFGTCNALLSLGENAYLEVLAPDPKQEGAAQTAWLESLPEGRNMLTWVMRTHEIDRIGEAARQAGAAIGKRLKGSRTAPDGTLIEWHLTEPQAMPFDGCVPFLIDWGSTPHPAKTNPRGGTLTGFSIEHPRAVELHKIFAAMGVDVEISEAEEAAIVVTIEGRFGPVTLR